MRQKSSSGRGRYCDMFSGGLTPYPTQRYKRRDAKANRLREVRQSLRREFVVMVLMFAVRQRASDSAAGLAAERRGTDCLVKCVSTGELDVI